jgi:hypothetical protein
LISFFDLFFLANFTVERGTLNNLWASWAVIESEIKCRKDWRSGDPVGNCVSNLAVLFCNIFNNLI